MSEITILSKSEILKLIEEMKIEIIPFDDTQVGPTSIDLTLGNEFRVFKKVREIFHVKEEVRFEEVTETVQVDDGDYLLLMPGETRPWNYKGKDKDPQQSGGTDRRQKQIRANRSNDTYDCRTSPTWMRQQTSS